MIPFVKTQTRLHYLRGRAQERVEETFARAGLPGVQALIAQAHQRMVKIEDIAKERSPTTAEREEWTLYCEALMYTSGNKHISGLINLQKYQDSLKSGEWT